MSLNTTNLTQKIVQFAKLVSKVPSRLRSFATAFFDSTVARLPWLLPLWLKWHGVRLSAAQFKLLAMQVKKGGCQHA